MGTVARLARQKISTTISPSTFTYLQQLIETRQAHTLAEAIDLAVEQLRVRENRERLADATASYFANLTEEASTEEQNLETALAQSAQGIDFDREP